MKKYVISFLSGVLTSILVFLIIGGGDKTVKTDTDTIVVWKTDTVPIVKDSILVRHETVMLPVETYITDTDSVVLHDSVIVQVPITQKMYSDDSTYTAYVSGFMPNLDSIRVATKEIMTISVKRNRFGLGVNAGYGISKNGLTPYIGLGVSYSIF